MPSHAGQRARGGQLNSSLLTLDRPETVVKGANGDVYTLPRRSAEANSVLVYHKVNGALLNPVTGARRKRGVRGLGDATKPRTLSFGAVAITAFIGFRAAQLLRRAFSKPRHPGEEELVAQQLEQQAAQGLPPPARVFPAMLQRALPQLGPPSRVKRLAQQHKSRPRRTPNAQAMMQTRGVAPRRATRLEKWDAAVRKQAHALMVKQQQPGAAAGQEAQQQLDCGRSVLALPALQPQPMLEVAETQLAGQQQP